MEERRNEIIESAYLFKLRRHNEGCGCNYCNVLIKYRRVLSEERTWAKKIEDIHDFSHMHQLLQPMNHLREIRLELTRLKEEKDKLKYT